MPQPKTKPIRYSANIRKAIELAEHIAKNNHTKTRIRAKIAAVITDGSEIISTGINQKKTHPYQAKFAKNPEAIYLHAEIDAIVSALRKTDIKGCTMIVSRMKYVSSEDMSYTLGNSKPCLGCAAALQHVGISRLIYSTDDGYVETKL